MKTFKHTHIAPIGGWGLHMNILLISALILGGCNIKDPIATPIDSPDYSIIDGDTVKNRIEKEYKDKKLKEVLLYGNKQILVGEQTLT